MKRQPVQRGRGPLELIEEALHLLRLAPAATLCAYYLGALPFVLGLLFFWADMSRGSFAAKRLALGALGMALLFLWMKVWQAVFTRRLLSRLCGENEAVIPWRSLWGIVVAQTILQPSGLIILPLALVVLFPFGWAYAFYQNVTVLAAVEQGSPRTLARQAWQQACVWPAQNNCGLLLLKLFGLFVFLNLISGFLVVPALLKTLLGVDTAFSRAGMAAFNTTFLAVIASLAYLSLDPLIKTFYVLRCFYGESLQTGRDLRAELRRIASARLAAGAVAVLFLAFGSPGLCQDDSHTPDLAPRTSHLAPRNSLSASDLDQAIRQVIAQREYNWRLPRENNASDEKEKGAIASFLESLIQTLRGAVQTVARWLEKLLDWLIGHRRPGAPHGSLAWLAGLRGVVLGLIVLLACALAVLLWRLWRRRHRVGEVVAQPIQTTPDVSDENVGADQLPEDGWFRLARELIGQGQFRLALRAFYLASLAHLADRNLIDLARFKSNRDYQRELDRRSHALPDLTRIFSENVVVFDRAWYGLHEVSREMLEQFAGNVERIKGLT